MESLIRDLFTLNDMTGDIREITNFAMEAGIRATKSQIGYVYFVHGDVLENVSWSKAAMEECEIRDKKTLYRLDEIGCWGNAVKSKKPTIMNWYPDDVIPNSKGLPEGHTPVFRHMNVPVLENNDVVLIGGVGNKEELYDELDIQKLTLVMEGLWRHLKRVRNIVTLEQSITNRTKELEVSKQFLRQIIDLLPVGIFWKDGNGLYLGSNVYNAEAAGFQHPIGIIGKTDADLVWKSQAEKYRNDDLYVINEGKPLLHIEEQIIKNGETRWVETNKVPIRDENNNIYGVLGCWQDITKLKELVQELQRSNQELSQFAFIASHDLKAPLRAIYNLANWIVEDAESGKDVTQYKELLNQKIKKMNGLIEGLLEYSRIGRTDKDIHEVHVKGIIESVLTEICDNGDSCKCCVSVDVPDNLVIKFNKTRLYQVFLNLIGNAFKHNDKHDMEISVTYKEDPTLHSFYIRDNGPGIDQQYHEKIFQIFQTLNPKVEGTGIGLALTKKIINDAGGDICLESDAGHGACFSFYFPKN